MQQAQVLVWDVESPLLDALQTLAQDRAVWLREVSSRKTCLNLVRQAGSGVLVLKLGKETDAQLTALEQVGRLFPEQAVIVVGDSAYPTLEALAWDLGAQYVLFPPQPVEMLVDLVKGYLPRKD